MTKTVTNGSNMAELSLVHVIEEKKFTVREIIPTTDIENFDLAVHKKSNKYWMSVSGRRVQGVITAQGNDESKLLSIKKKRSSHSSLDKYETVVGLDALKATVVETSANQNSDSITTSVDDSTQNENEDSNKKKVLQKSKESRKRKSGGNDESIENNNSTSPSKNSPKIKKTSDDSIPKIDLSIITDVDNCKGNHADTRNDSTIESAKLIQKRSSNYDELKKKFSAMKKELDIVKKERDALRLKNKNLNDLLIDATKTSLQVQKDVINQSGELWNLVRDLKQSNANLAQADGLFPGVGFTDPVTFTVHYGRGCYGRKDVWTVAWGVFEPKEFVRLLAKEIIGIEMLQTGTVTGQASRREKCPVKRKSAMKQIPPDQIRCIAEALQLFLDSKKFTHLESTAKSNYVAMVKTWISELAAEFKKPRRKHAKKNKALLNQSADDQETIVLKERNLNIEENNVKSVEKDQKNNDETDTEANSGSELEYSEEEAETGKEARMEIHANTEEITD